MFSHKHLAFTLFTSLFYVSNPASAQFMSADPVSAQAHLAKGNIQGFNPYTYANNNPYKFVDPDGRDAKVVIKKNGNINISIPTIFYGPGATQGNVSSIKQQIANKWSGNYNVNGKPTKVTVAVTKPGKDGIKNAIKLVTGKTSDESGRSFVSGSNSGEWSTNATDMSDGTMPHEAGHLMGADDQYVPTGGALPGHGADIMATVSGTPNDRVMAEILASDAVYIKDEQK